jgi:thioester reductase-like protein
VSTVLLTGATGFVGMEVLARLLERTDREVVALVRAADPAGARDRLYAVLERLGAEEHAGRVHAVAGDITSPGLGLTDAERDALAARIDAIVHCAASVSFSLPLDESRAINVEGTRRVLDLAERAPSLERIVHVSTAYVAGTVEGRFGEDDVDVGQDFRNAYEQSKLEAELLVRERAHLPAAIARPSIVVGDSSSGWTSSFNVVYFPLQAFARGLTAAVPADPEAIVDVVPVDYVADGILAALDAPEPATYNLVAGDGALRVGELAELAGRYFERPAPELIAPHAFDQSSPVLEQMEVYFPYFSVYGRFDDAHARSVGLKAPPLASYFDRIMDFAVAARWGKREPPRVQPVTS